MIDNIVEKIALRVFDMLKDYLDEKFAESFARVDEVQSIAVNVSENFTEEKINLILSRWKTELANEVTGRFRL